MGQGPYGPEKDPARLPLVSLCSREAMVRPDRGALVQETDLHHGGGNVIVSERALTSQGSVSQLRSSRRPFADNAVVTGVAHRSATSRAATGYVSIVFSPKNLTIGSKSLSSCNKGNR